MLIPIVRQAPRNPRAAIENRRWLERSGAIGLLVCGSPGSGKTALIEAITPRLAREFRVAVVAADVLGPGEPQRVGALGVPAVQVLTDGACHLSAAQLQHALRELPLAELDLVIIEAVGDLYGQSLLDVGEHLRLTTLAVSAGASAVAKCPAAFRNAHVVALTKCDLLPHVEFDIAGTVARLHELNPGGEVICADTRSRVGIGRLAGWVSGYVRAQGGRRPLARRCGASAPANALV